MLNMLNLMRLMKLPLEKANNKDRRKLDKDYFDKIIMTGMRKNKETLLDVFYHIYV